MIHWTHSIGCEHVQVSQFWCVFVILVWTFVFSEFLNVFHNLHGQSSITPSIQVVRAVNMVGGSPRVDMCAGETFFQGTVFRRSGSSIARMPDKQSQLWSFRKQYLRTTSIAGAFARDVSEDDALAALTRYQWSLHRWGRANRAAFGPSKDAFVIIRLHNAIGDEFKLFWVVFGPQWLMHNASRTIVSQAGRRVQSILRANKFLVKRVALPIVHQTI